LVGEGVTLLACLELDGVESINVFGERYFPAAARSEQHSEAYSKPNESVVGHQLITLRQAGWVKSRPP
jgi:hypothetical protein